MFFSQALGCLLFEMCALRYAFDASNFMSLFYKIVKVEHGVSCVFFKSDVCLIFEPIYRFDIYSFL